MRSILVIAFVLACSTTSASAEVPYPPARWSVSLYGRSMDDSLSNSKTVGTSLSLDLQKSFSEDLYGHFRGDLLLETGSSSSLFTDEFQPISHLGLVDARLRLTVAGPVFLAMGALSQELLANPVFISAGNTFPAGLITLRYNPSSWYWEGHAQAAIPTGSGLTTKSVGKQNSPELFTEMAVMGWRRNSDYFLEARATHFSFLNLTRGMAEDSRFYGNSITGIADAASFLYSYDGYDLDASGSLPLGSYFALIAGGSFVRNPRAPSDSNTGRYAYAGFTVLSSGFRLRPKAEYYENQADAAPAFYTSRDFGHNNRKGYGASLSLTLKQPAIEISLSARNTDLIASQPFQKDNFRYYDLKIGIPYEPL